MASYRITITVNPGPGVIITGSILEAKKALEKTEIVSTYSKKRPVKFLDDNSISMNFTLESAYIPKPENVIASYKERLLMACTGRGQNLNVTVVPTGLTRLGFMLAGKHKE